MNEGRRNDMVELLRNPIFDIEDVKEKALMRYDQALTHSSYANEMKDKGIECSDNERLEFLGNFVLGFVVSEHLFEKLSYSEGDMAKRMEVTSDEILAEIVRKKRLGIGRYLLLGKGELASDVDQKDSIIAGSLEALLGAIYLHKGMRKARQIVLNLLSEEIEHFDPEKNYVGRLQEYAQKNDLDMPEYSIERLDSADHRPIFRVTVEVGNLRATGEGKNKSSARKEAAKMALKELREG